MKSILKKEHARAIFVIGYHLYCFSYLSIGLIATTYLVNYLVDKKLKQMQLSFRARENIKDLTNFLNPVVCESTKDSIAFNLNSCDLAKVISLTMAEAHNQFINPSSTMDYVDALRNKFISVAVKLIAEEFFISYGTPKFIAFTFGQFVGNAFYEDLKTPKDKEPSIVIKPGLKALMSTTTKWLLADYLKSFKGCDHTRDFLTTTSAVAFYIFHDFVRDSLYLTGKYFLRDYIEPIERQ